MLMFTYPMSIDIEQRAKSKLNKLINLVFGADCSLVFLFFDFDKANIIALSFIASIIFIIILEEKHQSASIKYLKNVLGVLIIIGIAGYCYIQGLFAKIAIWLHSFMRDNVNGYHENVAKF